MRLIPKVFGFYKAFMRKGMKRDVAPLSLINEPFGKGRDAFRLVYDFGSILSCFDLKKQDFVAFMKQSLIILVFWLFGVVNLFHPLLFSLKLGDIGDTRLNLYALEHQFKVITDLKYPGKYATAPFWYPESENNMASSDMLTGAQPLYFLPRLFLPRDNAYHVFFILAATFNFLVFFWLLRSLRVQTLVAGLAAWVFAFGMHNVQHMVHVQLFVQFWGALSLICLIHFLKSPTRPTLFFAVLLLGLQTLASPYSGIFYSIGSVFLIGLYTLFDSKAARTMFAWCHREFFTIVGLLVTAIAPVAILLWPYLRNAQAFQRRAWSEVSLSFPDPGFWINPLQGTLWWFVKRLAGMSIKPGESHFIGFIFILLTICSGSIFVLYRPWREEARSRLALVLLMLAIVLILLISQFGEGKTPWLLVYKLLPGANGIRDVRRISLVVNFCFIVSGAIFLDWLVQRSRSDIRRILLVVCISITLLENCTLLSLIPAERWRQWDIGRHFNFYNKLNNMFSYPDDWYGPQSAEMAKLIQNASAAYVYNDPQVPEWAHENNVKLVGQEVNTPVMNGLTASFPPGYKFFMGPREVMEKGTKFDFNGFAYLVPLTQETRMREELRQTGLSFVSRGRYFALYKTYVQKGGYDVNFQIIGVPPNRLRTNEQTSVPILVTNRSLYPWQPFGFFPTNPSYRILLPHTERDVGIGLSTPLKEVLFPGESALVRLMVKAPEQQGNFIIRPAMVQESSCWFGPKDHTHPVQFSLAVSSESGIDSSKSSLKNFSQEITTSAKLSTLKVGQRVSIPVTIKNIGDETWPAKGEKPVHLAYHWLGSEGKKLAVGKRAFLKKDLAPAESTTLALDIIYTPTIPGEYTLRLSMVQETVAWFYGKGGKPLNLKVTIKGL